MTQPNFKRPKWPCDVIDFPNLFPMTNERWPASASKYRGGCGGRTTSSAPRTECIVLYDVSTAGRFDRVGIRSVGRWLIADRRDRVGREHSHPWSSSSPTARPWWSGAEIRRRKEKFIYSHATFAFAVSMHPHRQFDDVNPKFCMVNAI